MIQGIGIVTCLYVNPKTHEYWIIDYCIYDIDHYGYDNGNTSNSTPSTPSTPSYHTCGVHETTVSGDHSMQASCSLHTSGGQSCSVINFYACDGHTPVYPSVDNTQDCSNCTDGCSTCQATCTAGHTYDPREKSNVNTHRTRTCRRSNCGQTWQVCVSDKPDCLAASGFKCRAEES